MKDAAKSVLVLVLVAIVLAIVAPMAIMAFRVSETWSAENTGQLLGGTLTCLGSLGAIFGAMLGAGVFARFAGWKPPRRDVEPMPMPPMIYAQPPLEWDERPQLPAPPTAPPWGMTGGGQFDMLPAPQQDRRFSMSMDGGSNGDRDHGRR